MLQGIHLATQGMTTLMQKQEQIANNLANVNTTGFKQSGLFTRTMADYLTNDQGQVNVNSQIRADDTYLDFAEGTPKKSGNPLDVMIHGSGFFKVMTPHGTRYTRNGNFSLNKDGFLTTMDGSKVMGPDGFIRLDKQQQVHIAENGEIYQDTVLKGQLHITDFEKPYRLIRTGNSYLRPQLPDNPERPTTTASLRQGYLESSNVSVMRNMVAMIAAHRNFEADQRAVAALDETAQKAIREVGSVR